ncbi:MAG TPA: ABC transporter substrate-binding protein [Stellaceae bacterium]|jgi:NitT/TauT family transport system substrate-binding protein|nr:ABC transporter substrate-binding protein [Stellaceae bacterium]
MLREGLIALAGAAMLLTLPAASRAAETTKLALGYGLTSDYLPAYIAKENGIFAKHGLDVDMKAVTSSSLAPPALVSNSLQISQATPPNLLLANDGGMDLVSVAGVGRLTAAHPHTSLVTHPGFTIAAAKDLVGKKIAVPGINSAMDLVLRKWLLDGKVKLAQVTIVEAPFQQMGDMLKSGQLDAAFQFEPLLSRILAAGSASKSLDIMSSTNPDVLGAIYASTREWANAHRAAIVAFNQSLAEGIAFEKEHPEEAHKIEAKYIGYSTPTLPDAQLLVSPADFKFWADICDEVGVLHHPVDAATLIFK